jgi:argininosuccinate lyase
MLSTLPTSRTSSCSANRASFPPAHGELYNCRDHRFAEQIGRDAGWPNAGRPRREAIRVALQLRVRRDVVETLIADQNYLQPAQPSTFGHYLLAMVYPVLREIDRLTAELDGVNRSPAGAGGVNGSPLTGDRERMAALLGFDGVIEHTRDAMWQADGLTALVVTAASLVTTLAKLAEDLEIFSSGEFGYVSLADGHTRTSVLMPQKRNPYALTMVRGEAGILIGRPTGLLATSRAPSAQSRAGEADGHRAGQCDHRSLRRAVRGEVRDTDEPGHRALVDDRPPPAEPPVSRATCGSVAFETR